MKRLIIIGLLLVATQSWAGDARDTFVYCDGSTRMYKTMDDLGMDKEKIPVKERMDRECAKLDEFIKQAAGGDDKIYDGLMDAFGEFANDKYIGANAKKYERKLQMAQQRAMLKAKQAEERP